MNLHILRFIESQESFVKAAHDFLDVMEQVPSLTDEAITLRNLVDDFADSVSDLSDKSQINQSDIESLMARSENLSSRLKSHYRAVATYSYPLD